MTPGTPLLWFCAPAPPPRKEGKKRRLLWISRPSPRGTLWEWLPGNARRVKERSWPPAKPRRRFRCPAAGGSSLSGSGSRGSSWFSSGCLSGHRFPFSFAHSFDSLGLSRVCEYACWGKCMRLWSLCGRVPVGASGRGQRGYFLCSIQGFIPLAIPLLTRVLRAISKREGDKGKLLIGQLNSFGTWWFHWCFSAIVFFCLWSDFLFFLSFSGIAKLHVVIYWLLRCIFSGKYDSKLSHFPW